MVEAAGIDYTGACMCGEVEYTVKGAVKMNGFCHCRPCSMGIGVSPVHLVATAKAGFAITKGEDKTVVVASGNLKFTKCTACHTPVNQYPEGPDMVAAYPRMFKGYVDGKKNTFPADLMPTAHVNYENRQMDWADALPKFAAFPPNNMMDNAGNAV